MENLAKKCTKEIRLLVLHWKILHNIYPTYYYIEWEYLKIETVNSAQMKLITLNFFFGLVVKFI